MNWYRVDFYIDHGIVGSTKVKACSRFDAWVDSWKTPEYAAAKAKANEANVQVFYDATVIKCPVNVKCEVLEE